MTIREIAKLAGVAPSTVSRVLNSPDGSFGTKDVQERIWKIVQESGYTLNKAAQELRRGGKKEIETVNKGIACVFGRRKSTLLSDLGRYVEYQGMESGYPVLSTYSLNDVNNKEVFDVLSSIQVSGAVVVGQPSKEMAELLKNRYKNIVYLGLHKVNFSWDQVICDAYLIAKEAFEYLFQMGHRKIAYIGKVDQDFRYRAYKDMMNENGIEYKTSYIQKTDSSPMLYYNAAQKLLENNKNDYPTAVFCANDNTAIAAMKAFQDAGIKVPKDISVISAQNLEIAQYATPMLTSVNVPTKQMGITAVKILTDRVENGKDLPMIASFPHKLIIRESVQRL